MAQNNIISGAMIVHIISSERMIATCHSFVPGGGMLGCTLTHAHANIVARQFQTMSQVDRVFGQFEFRILPGDGDDMCDKIG